MRKAVLPNKESHLNIQTEHLDNHTARFTVEIDSQRMDKAKTQAARKIARRINIPGFRKGKAPYRIVAGYVGEAAIIEDAVEVLGNEVYKELLKQSDIEPYGPGSLEDFKLDEAPIFIFTVPLQPTVQLNDYRAIREDYEAPTVDDDMVDRAMLELRYQHALVEDSSSTVAPHNRVMVDIHSEFIDDAPEPDAADSEDDAPAAATLPAKGDEFVHRHDALIVLDPENEPVLPGFIAALAGAAVDEEREFELIIPDDSEAYKEIAGRTVNFHVTVKRIETVTLPELNDEFAARVTEEEETPLTLLELRMRTRKQLEEEAERLQENEYANKVLDKIVEQATIAFPDQMVMDQAEDMVGEFEQRLRQQRITLNDYYKIANTTREAILEQYREPAVRYIQRSLTLREIMLHEQVKIDAADINAEVDRILSQFGDESERFRQFFDTPQMRESITNDLLTRKVMARIGQIGKGEAPDLSDEAAQESVIEAGEAAAETEVEIETTVDTQVDNTAE